MDPLFHPLFSLSTSWAYALVCFLFGLCVGSFLNVVIYRLPHRISVIRPGSRCPGCGRHIRAWENIPVLSWILMRGRCRGCRAMIHWRYPGVELITGILWGVSGLIFHNLQGWNLSIPAGLPGVHDGYLLMLDGPGIIRVFTLIAILWFVSMMITISFIDYDLTLIPDELNFTGMTLALISSTLLPNLHFPVIADGNFTGLWFGAVSPALNGLLVSIVGMITGAGSIYLLGLIGTVFFRGTIERVNAEEDEEVESAMGFGDVKLMAFLGAFLGWQAILATFLLSSVLGSLAGVAVKLLSGRLPVQEEETPARRPLECLILRWKSGRSMIPFGPFLCASALILLFWRDPILKAIGRHFTLISGG